MNRDFLSTHLVRKRVLCLSNRVKRVGLGFAVHGYTHDPFFAIQALVLMRDWKIEHIMKKVLLKQNMKMPLKVK